MSVFQEFKTFIARGNVLDLAVGVIIGAAFGGIVTSLTESIIMPIIGAIFGDVDFTNWFVLLGDIPATYTGDPANYAQLKAAGVPMLGYGDFATQLLNFLIIAFALFLLIKAVNRLMEKVKREQAAEEAQAEATELEVLKDILAELRQKGGSSAPGGAGTQA